jgi:DNA-binding MarR family transcriptional regulator
MPLGKELRLKQPFEILEHEALLNIYYTAALMKKRADEFFNEYSLTDVQFNVLMLLATQSNSAGGLSQAKIGEMMLVNRANITALIDRMEKAGLVARVSSVNDRRSNIIKMTSRGKKLYGRAAPLYYKQIAKLMFGINTSEQKRIIAVLERIRAGMQSKQQGNFRSNG